MYEGIDAAAYAEESAQPFVERDRAQFVPYLARAEKFAANNRMVVGSLRALLPRPPGPGDYTLELFTAQAWEHAKKLAQALHELDPQGLGRYVALQPKIPGAEYVVSVHGRDLVRVTAFGKGRNSPKVEKTAMPVALPGIWGGATSPKVLSFDAELHLLRCYAALCDFERAAEWPDLLRQEAELRAILLKRIRPKVAAAIKGGGPPTGGRARLAAALAAEFGPRLATIGAAGRLKYITPEPFADEQKVIRAVAAQANVPVHISVDDPQIPTDPRLRRLSVFCTSSERRELVLQIYNVAQHELVPVVGKGAKAKGGSGGGAAPATEGVSGGGASPAVEGGGSGGGGASPAVEGGGGGGAAAPPSTRPPPADLLGSSYVQMRFALVELWTVLLLRHLDALPRPVATELVDEALRGYEEAAAGAAAATPAALFPAAFIGRRENPDLAARRALYAATREKKRFAPPYFPLRG